MDKAQILVDPSQIPVEIKSPTSIATPCSKRCLWPELQQNRRVRFQITAAEIKTSQSLESLENSTMLTTLLDLLAVE